MTIKKYRLEKLYPGSPKLHSIIDSTSYQHNNMIINVLDYPEFWKEYIEKNYEILSLNNPKYYFPESSKLKLIEGYSTEEFEAKLKEHRHLKIHSIKRLSDGEIFTVSDIVTCNESRQFTGSITNFQLDKLGIIVHYNGFDDLKSITKVKKPLFTTKDSVDIFEGDTFWSVTSNFIKIELQITNNKHSLDFIKIDKQFSTKEKAEEYIFYNKPCLSLNDVASIFASATKKVTERTNSNSRNYKIQELVKSKIK